MMIDNKPVNWRSQKRFVHTTKTNETGIEETDFRKEKPEASPVDYNRPPGEPQMVGGRPVYQYGPPPPPIHGGRMGASRSGDETAMARVERGQSPQGGGIWSVFGSREPDRNDDDDENSGIFEFDTVAIRNAFVRKVYSLLTIQLLITFGLIFVSIHVEDIRIFFRRNRVIIFIVAPLTIVFNFAIVCCEGLRKTFPTNLIVLCILTLLYAFMLAAVSCMSNTVAVYMATGTTAIVCLIISLLACQIKYDITKCACILYILLIGLLIYGMACSIMFFFVKPGTFRIMHLIFAGIGLAIFIPYLMFDTQLIMGGYYMEISPEEYIYGSIRLYIDVIMIFQNLLTLFSE